MTLFRKMKTRMGKQHERGVALFIALVALLLMAAIATGMMFMANTESAINYNYRDAQFTYFAAGAGLEDAREKLRTDSIVTPKYTPKGIPSAGNKLGIIYILNPLGGETVAPWDPANKYFDDELCHEYSSQLGIADPGVNVPCTQGAPAGSYTFITSDIEVNNNPLAGSNSALVYKWVRISLKYNYTLVPSATTTGYAVDISDASNKLVCWENESGHEFLNTGLPLQNPAPNTQPSGFELAALQQAIDAGLGSPAVFMFGGKGKSTSTSGTTTSSSSTTGTSTSGTSTGSTSGSTTGSTSGSSTGTTSGSTSGTTSGSTTGTSGTTTTGTTSGSTTGTSGTTTTGTTSGTTTGTTSGSTTATTGGTTTGTPRPGYYAAIDDCNAKDEHKFSVYLVTSLAVSKRGAKRMAQYEISRSTFPQIPGGLTFNGPGATFAPPSSTNYNIDGVDHATSGSDCIVDPLNPKKVHAITAFTATDQKAIQDSITKYPDHYTGLGGDLSPSLGGPLSPDVVNGSVIDPQTGYVPLDGLTTVKENTDLVSGLSASADLNVPVPAGATQDAGKILPKSSQCYAYPFGTLDTSAPAKCQGTRITVVDGNLAVSNLSGAGILVVTGDLTISGHVSFDGLILVIGTGNVITKGGANVDINGGMYVANTKDPSGNLGAVKVDMSGGGNSNLFYDSCKIANATANQSFRVITYREMTY